MHRYLIVLIISICFFTNVNGEVSISIHAVPGSHVLDEWKTPGRYSVVNAFDGDIKTCYAEGRGWSHKGDFEINFDKYITMDEIRFAAGYFKSKELFKLNNRLKEINIAVTDKIKKESKIITLTFNDKMEFQSKKIKKIKVKSIFFSIEKVYSGLKYNDTCISEIQFFNNGKEIIINNKKKLKQQYISHLESKLINLFQDKKYEFNLCNDGKVFFSSNGNIKHNLYGPCNKALPKKWKVKDARLFFFYNGKWQLVKYTTGITFESFQVYKIGNTDFDYNIEYMPLN